MLRHKPPPPRDPAIEEIEPPRRLGFIRLFMLLAAAAFVVLVYQLYQIQIVQFDYFRAAADQNRFRLVTTSAPRGVIYDRNGKILVRNEPSFNASIVPIDLPSDQQDQVLTKLSKLIDAPLDTTLEADVPDAVGSLASDVSRTFVSPTRKPGLRELVSEGRHSDLYAPVLLKTNIPRGIAFILQERAQEFPGLRVGVDPVRRYTEGALMSHLLGYIGHIPREQFDDYKARGYGPTDQVGLTGLELTYEDQLRGVVGQRHIEVDATGNEVGLVAEEKARPGNNLYLAMDVEFQRQVEAAVQNGLKKTKSKQAVAIVMDVNNGDILALVSSPSYDDNLFARGIKLTDYQALSQDPLHPLVNQAIGGLYPPGSTYKLVAAAGALQEGVIDDKTYIYDPGEISVPNKYFPDDPKLAQPFFCWFRPGHGALTIREGIAQSCDVFFYKLTGGFTDFPTPLEQNLLSDYARLFGYGAATGIDLPGELAGLVPDPAWKKRTLNEAWVTGDTYNMAIGQGFALATPLQVLNMTAAVANGGTLYRPRLIEKIVNASGTLTNTVAPQTIRKLPVDARNLQIVREGMRAAVTHGTSWRANLAEVKVAGKTGTAEYFGPRVAGHLPTHAWFVAFAPYEKPQIAVVVFVFGGGEGSEVAVPITADILRLYFNLPLSAPLAKPSAPPPPPEARSPKPDSPAAAPPHKFVGHLVGIQDDSNNERPTLEGKVLDALGRGLAGVNIALDLGDGKPVMTTTSGAGGVFRLESVEFHDIARYFIRVTSPGDSAALAIDIAPYKRYTVVFNAITQ